MAWAPDYAATSDLRAYLRVPEPESPAVDDDEVQMGLALTASSRAIDRTTNRQFGVVSTATARLYTATYRSEHAAYGLTIDDLMSVTNLAIAADADGDGVYETAITDYTLFPLNAAADGRPWTVMTLGVTPPLAEGRVQVTALWGWTAVPDTIKNACLLQSSRFFKRRDAPFGVAGSPELGSEMRLLAKLDPDVAVMVAAYRRWWGAA